MHCSRKRNPAGAMVAAGLALVLVVMLGLYLCRPTTEAVYADDSDDTMGCVTLAEAKTTQDYDEFKDEMAEQGLTCPAAPTKGWCPQGQIPQWTYYPGGQPSSDCCSFSQTETSSYSVKCANNAIEAIGQSKVAVTYIEYSAYGPNSYYTSFCKQIKDAIASGFNVIILAFYLDNSQPNKGPWDSCRLWASMPDAYKASIMNAVHCANAVMLASYGGAGGTDGAPTGDLLTTLSQWTYDNYLDGVDFDLENAPANVSSAKPGWTPERLGQASKGVKDYFAKKGEGRKCIVTHAPQGTATYTEFSKQGYPPQPVPGTAPYIDLWKKGYGKYIDWLNVQFYNQSVGVDDTFELLRGKVQGMIDNGIPGNQIVIGKCMKACTTSPWDQGTPPDGPIACLSGCGAGDKGFVGGTALAGILSQFNSNKIPYKGLMLWEWAGTTVRDDIGKLLDPLGLSTNTIAFPCPTGTYGGGGGPPGPDPTTGPDPPGPTVPPATCDDGCPAGCLMPKPTTGTAPGGCAYSWACGQAGQGTYKYCEPCTGGAPPCAACQEGMSGSGQMICQAWSCDMDTADACTQKGGTVCGNNPTPCPGGDGTCYEVAAGSTNDGRHKIFPTQRKVPEKVLWGYWCQNTMTGAVCSGVLPSPGKTTTKDGTLLPTSKESIALLIDSGINLLTMFCNIWQPKVGWSNSGNVFGSEGYPTGSWSTSYGTENNGGNPGTGTGANPFGDSPKQKCGAAHVKALQQAGVSVLLTIGSWDAIFPRDGNTGYATKMPGRWTDDDVKDFVDTLETMAVALGPGDGGKIDGFDFDLEGFGAGPVASKEGAWGEWCTKFAGRDGGPYPNETQLGVTGVNDSTGPTPGWSADKQASATFTNINNPSDTQTYKWSDYADDYRNFMGIDPSKSTTQSQKGYTRGCYSFPDKGTIDTFNRVFAKLKEKQYIVTVVPMSTGLYANTPEPSVMDPLKQPQNQFVVHGLNHKNVDGIMLQWYSGAGLDICPDGSGGFKQCNDDLDNQCDTSDKNDTNKNRQVALKDALKTLSGTELANQPFWPKEDSIIVDVPLAPTIEANNKCPYKCPRKIDCPDWAYTGETPFASQVKVLKSIKEWLGDDFSKKLVVGLEAFPNFPGKINMASGVQFTNAQFWGPVPSAQALIGLDDALKGSKGKAKLLKDVVDDKGLAGLGVYTANTAFVGKDNCSNAGCQDVAMQYGLKKSIYHLLKKWKTDSLQ